MLVVGDRETIESGDPDTPGFTLADLGYGDVVEISLPDVFTMEYPSVP